MKNKKGVITKRQQEILQNLKDKKQVSVEILSRKLGVSPLTIRRDLEIFEKQGFIKKFYGETDFYECDADSIDKNDLNILTKPITSCKNKKSIFNIIITLDGTKLLSGYLDYNSYLDIYVEIDDEEDTNISISKLI